MSVARPGAVLFDLDGTLTDPFEGITRSIRHALGRMGRAAPEQEALRWVIGPPLTDTFPLLLESTDATLIDEAIRHYRERYSETGKLENVLIEGIPDVLATLKAEGHFLSVATSKLKTYARDIVMHFGLDGYFDAFHGSELDGRNAHKPDLIRHILTTEGLDPASTVMVGDRSHDVIGAKANGIGCIGVLWGFGSSEELQGSGADALATEPSRLPGMIRSLLPPAG